MRYSEVWKQIKADHIAVLTVCEDYAPTVIQGVKRTKCMENAMHARLGLPTWPRLIIEQENLGKRYVKITFKLLYDFRI